MLLRKRGQKQIKNEEKGGKNKEKTKKKGAKLL